MSAALRTAFWNYDRTLALIDGRVEVEGHELAIEVLRPEVTFAKAFSDAAFDVCEISFSNTVTSVSKQDFPYALIPIFLSRAFRHSAIFIRTDRGIERPEDLKGKTVGLQEYDMTAAVVVRGFLRDQYGVEPRDIAWKVGELERTKPLEFPSDARPRASASKFYRQTRAWRIVCLRASWMRSSSCAHRRPFEPAIRGSRRCLPIRSRPKGHGSRLPGIFRSCTRSAFESLCSTLTPGWGDACSMPSTVRRASQSQSLRSPRRPR